MSKSINKVQSDILLNRMQNNRPIACGFVKVSKDVVKQFWTSIVEELNSAGPPLKSINEWKKVWIDQKRYVRSKAAANLRSQRGTGGGPNLTKSLSANEQCVFDLIGMKESVEGLENSFCFGLPNDFYEGEQNEAMTSSHEVKKICSDSPTSSKILTPPRLVTTIREESSEKKVVAKKRRIEPQEKLTTSELIAKELKSQEYLCSTIAQISESVQTRNKEMEAAMKRVYRSLEKNNDLKSKKLNELLRHNAVLEKLRAKEVENKIEKNKRLIEIEDIKLELFRKKNSYFDKN